MFKSMKQLRTNNTESTNHYGSLNSLSGERKDAPSPTATNNRRTIQETISASSQSATPIRETQTLPQSLDSSESFGTFWDAHDDDATTVTNPVSSTSASSKRQSKVAVSGSTLSASAVQSAFDRGAESATTVTNQIVADTREVVDIIANYAVEPQEMLHLVDRWLQQLLSEFEQQRDHFKYRLGEKWQNGELTNIKYDNNDRTRRIYDVYKELETARNTILSREAFDEWNSYLGKINETSTEEMKEKFRSLADKYSEIVRCLEFVDRETKSGVGSGDNYINDMKKTLSKLKRLNNKQSHTICIVGLEKAGKSTFINALLGYEFLPAAAERCTQVRTVLRPPTLDSQQQLLATVKFYNDNEFQLFFSKMVKKTDENQQQYDERKTQVMKARDTLKSKFPEEHFRMSNSHDVQTERLAIRGQLYEYITGEVYVNIIKEIAIYTDKLPGKNYELLDVPGFDSPIKEHRDAGLEAIKMADAFVFLTNGQQPSLTQPQIHLLHEIQQNHFEAMQRAFGIITKLDLCQTPTIYHEHHQKAYQELIDKKFQSDHIYVACSRLEILEKTSEEYRVIDRKLRHFGDDLIDGFQRSKDGLNTFIEFELPKTHLKQLIDLGRMNLVQSVVERLDRIKERQLLPENLTDNMSINEYIKQQKRESWDQIYSEKIFEPAFAQANYWHTTIVTKERLKFIEDVKQKFHNSFLDRTHEFVQSTHSMEQLMFEAHGYSKQQLNIHPTDNNEREKLSIQLEKIVDETSDDLAKHLYYQYICGLEKILNDICPYLKDFYRTKLTLEKCLYETHALILRVCRPVIIATLRYSHLDLPVKQDAINELIYIAPIVAFNIAHSSKNNHHHQSEEHGLDIRKAVESLMNQNEMTTSIIRALFNK